MARHNNVIGGHGCKGFNTKKNYERIYMYSSQRNQEKLIEWRTHFSLYATVEHDLVLFTCVFTFSFPLLSIADLVVRI